MDMDPTSPTSPTSPITPGPFMHTPMNTPMNLTSLSRTSLSLNPMSQTAAEPAQEATVQVLSHSIGEIAKADGNVLGKRLDSEPLFTLGPAPAQNQSKPGVRLRAPQPPSRLQQLLARLRYPLAPLQPLPNGPPHPSFPATLLHYHLLTEPQLDSIATYYHQRAGPVSPSRIWAGGYPASMHWDDAFLTHVAREHGVGERVRRKRRKVGRFIGLRDCDTPIEDRDEEDRWRRRMYETVPKGDIMDSWGRRGWGM